MATGDGDVERRMDCKNCLSHREHSNQIKNIEKDVDKLDGTCRENSREMWDGIKDKVPYRHFIAAIGFIITAIVAVSTLNWNVMTKVLDSNHRVELQVTKIEEQIKGTNQRMDDFSARLSTYESEHNFFRQAILSLMETKEAKAKNNDYIFAPPPSNFPNGD